MCLQDFPGNERAVPVDARSLRREQVEQQRIWNNQHRMCSTMVEQHCEISESLWEVHPNLLAPVGSYPGMLSGGCTQTLHSLKRYPFSTSTNPYHVPISWYGVNLSLSPRSTGRSRYCLMLGGSLDVGEWWNSEGVIQ